MPLDAPPDPPVLWPDDLKGAADRVERLAEERRRISKIDDLAKAAGKPQQSFQNWKQGHGEPKLSTVQAFASVVGVSVRVVLQDASTGEAHLGANIMIDDEMAELRSLLSSLPENTRAGIIGVAKGLAMARLHSSPSVPAEDKNGAHPGRR